MELGVFIPIGNNGWLISTNADRQNPDHSGNGDRIAGAERRRPGAEHASARFAVALWRHGAGGSHRRFRLLER
jgi:hypothetical protein